MTQGRGYSPPSLRPMYYDLPTSVDIDGEDFAIRSDYRAILDIFEALNDVELTDQERAEVVLGIFYPDLDRITDHKEALRQCFSFINMGQTEPGKKQPKLVAWDKDFSLIVAPVNRVLGYEIRSVPYDYEHNTGGVHWYTFLSAYYEIGGDCTFAQVVSIRDKLQRHKKLDKADQEFYRRHRDMVDIQARYTDAENTLVKEWT